MLFKNCCRNYFSQLIDKCISDTHSLDFMRNAGYDGFALHDLPWSHRNSKGGFPPKKRLIRCPNGFRLIKLFFILCQNF